MLFLFLFKAKLQSTFEPRGFLVRRYDNLTHSQMMQTLMAVALEDHSNYDCFVCCILSHGTRDCVYGSDGYKVNIKELMKNLQACRCPTLARKPKLFFIQACQGNESMGETLVFSDVVPMAESESGRVLAFWLNNVVFPPDTKSIN